MREVKGGLGRYRARQREERVDTREMKAGEGRYEGGVGKVMKEAT